MGLLNIFRRETSEQKDNRRKLEFGIFEEKMNRMKAENDSKYTIRGFEKAVLGREGDIIRGIVDAIYLGRYFEDRENIETIRINPTIINPLNESRYLAGILNSRGVSYFRGIPKEKISLGDEVAILTRIKWVTNTLTPQRIEGYLAERVANYTTREAFIDEERIKENEKRMLVRLQFGAVV